ncbi:deoxyribodipyrimidine photo-lyase [uncultured Propionivibrio sp.]|uniref:cryptochrome/photolyase family protein n=1 Tax=uncultured Propionivibrio sp. TaxID=426737 RepID=UPI0029BFF888|nr:deoxyribodipyrimidine photo-lyase [uncultured Propionivibrio sp.]
MFDSILVWFRRDLRDEDNAALAEATRRARRVYCAFIFDRDILDALSDTSDARVAFIHASLLELDAGLRQRGGALIVRTARAVESVPALAAELGVDAVFANRDYEPAAKRRDGAVEAALAARGISFVAFKDQALRDGAEVLAQSGRPLTVFTPYRNAWLRRFSDDDIVPFSLQPGRLAVPPCAHGVPTLTSVGFKSPADALPFSPGVSGAQAALTRFESRLGDYAVARDFPALDGTSGLSPHLRFGTMSIRRLVTLAIGGARAGREGAAKWLDELIWRDFYFMILDHFPHVADGAFRREFDALKWESGAAADRDFAAWCEGATGFPLVDAAMRQLRRTGWMHNRLRMLTASFLTKDLGIDWRRGEAYFAERLLDFDLAANNGGWQWSASTGCDAQPYFRIFNPVTQSERFDAGGRFIRRFVPELAAVPDRFIHAPWTLGDLALAAHGVRLGVDYPRPCVDHAEARRRTLARYAVVKKGSPV